MRNDWVTAEKTHVYTGDFTKKGWRTLLTQHSCGTYIPHSDYTPLDPETPNDIALIFLTHDFDFSNPDAIQMLRICPDVYPETLFYGTIIGLGVAEIGQRTLSPGITVFRLGSFLVSPTFVLLKICSFHESKKHIDPCYV